MARPGDWPLTYPTGEYYSFALRSSQQATGLDFGVFNPNQAAMADPDGKVMVWVDAPEGVVLMDMKQVANPSPEDFPANVSTPIGFVEWWAQGLPPGGETTVTYTLAEGTPVNTYYRFGPTRTTLSRTGTSSCMTARPAPKSRATSSRSPSWTVSAATTT